MDYEKKLKDALKDGHTDYEVVRWIESNFPELAESEGEMIRKVLVEFFKSYKEQDTCGAETFNGIPTYNILAWLEKQGEQKPTDKVEPKFKVGDWITDGEVVFHITSYHIDYGYQLETQKGTSFHFSDKKVENKYHLWTIQDAKDGDVLSYVTDEEDLWIMIYWSLYEPYEGHVHYHALLVNDNFGDKGTCCICIDNLKPATQEQRDLLFNEMRKSGYRWDADKKELEKIVIDDGKAEMDYCFTKMMAGEKVSPTWSEEGEKAFAGVIGFLNLCGQFGASKFIASLKERLGG